MNHLLDIIQLCLKFGLMHNSCCGTTRCAVVVPCPSDVSILHAVIQCVIVGVRDPRDHLNNIQCHRNRGCMTQLLLNHQHYFIPLVALVVE